MNILSQFGLAPPRSEVPSTGDGTVVGILAQFGLARLHGGDAAPAAVAAPEHAAQGAAAAPAQGNHSDDRGQPAPKRAAEWDARADWWRQNQQWQQQWWQAPTPATAPAVAAPTEPTDDSHSKHGARKAYSEARRALRQETPHTPLAGVPRQRTNIQAKFEFGCNMFPKMVLLCVRC